MAQAENDVTNKVRIAFGKIGAPLYRNNVGYDERKKLRYGLKKGSADWIGILPLVITPDMVGKRVGVFLSVEMKSAGGSLQPDQAAWINTVRSAGGIAIVARRPEDIPEWWEFPDAKTPPV